MTITASLVSELRKSTGCGIMDCKKALLEADGDVAKASEILRKKGIAKAAKKADRVTAEGVVKVLCDDTKAVIVEVNCETDFVARDESFNEFVDLVSKAALASEIKDVDGLNKLIVQGTQTIEDLRKALIGKLGENINVRRVQLVASKGLLGSYVHGGRIGVLVAVDGGDEALAKDLAMQIAAANPSVISADQVPQESIEKEKEIFKAQALKSGKPEAVIEKMIEGRVKKFVNEISLTGQAFVKDPKKSVGDLLKAQQATVSEFVRFELGEGIEKQECNFAEEVKALSN